MKNISIFLLIVFSSINAFCQPASDMVGSQKNDQGLFTIIEYNSLPVSDTYEDKITGLKWKSCQLIEKFDQSQGVCVSDREKFKNWAEAVVYIDKQNKITGEKWRLPNFQQILSLYSCVGSLRDQSEMKYFSEFKYKNISIVTKPKIQKTDRSDSDWVCRDSIFHKNKNIQITHIGVTRPVLIVPANSNHGEFVSSDKYSYKDVSRFSEYDRDNILRMLPRVGADANIANSMRSVSDGKYILVQGEGEDWDLAVRDAYEVYGKLTEEAKRQNEKTEKWVRDGKVAAQKQQEQAIENQKTRDSDLLKLIRNVKIGDDIKQGLVLEVKGEMVLVQTYKYVCTMYMKSGECNTLSYKKVVANNEWIKRSDIKLPR
ncbi:DUF1566 domain-containing protein [Limnohabitans planktonicus]|uniref:DUF1566 domain-containing protein n=1 Tax=Limnohabitans planktonicus TaxID=540060 RepID=UPI000AA9A7EB|nr:DUF1566 domain-containing protein [Limnohabitans planktonicus]